MNDYFDKATPDRRAEIYLADDDLIIAAEVAMELNQPLLLAGEPGTGKTTFANYLAGKLGPKWFDSAKPFPLYSFETKSTSVATDLFYRFDSLRRFQAGQTAGMSQHNRDYLTFEALGLAILHSNPYETIADILPQGTQAAANYPAVGRAVVLIDEIDKAPRDFPNDILNEIERMAFRIPELQQPGSHQVRRVQADPALRPLVVLTSNSEKNLPPAFLRRCVFHHIAFPGRERIGHLRNIIAANLGQAVGCLAEDALDFFLVLREELNLDKAPTTAELVAWIALLQKRAWKGERVDPVSTALTALPMAELLATLGVLAKSAEDLAKVQALLRQRFSSAG